MNINNELAQICNNLFCILQQAKACSNSVWLVNESVLAKAIGELEAEYDTLFKLIYGDK